MQVLPAWFASQAATKSAEAWEVFRAIRQLRCYSGELWTQFEGAQRANKVDRMLESKRASVKEHKFQIGQTVYFTSRPVGQMAADSTYRIVKLLPSDGDDYQYRIKSASEAFERVAKESQLDRYR